MERPSFDQKTTPHPANQQEEVRGILRRILRLATQAIAKKLFARSQAGANRSQGKLRLPKT